MKRIILAIVLLLFVLTGVGYAQDIDAVRKAAEQGQAHAQFQLGLMYDRGVGVPQNHQEAAKWFLKAAERMDADDKKSQEVNVDTLRKKAEDGDMNAQKQLGWMFLHGKGVQKDYMEANKWYNMSDVVEKESIIYVTLWAIVCYIGIIVVYYLFYKFILVEIHSFGLDHRLGQAGQANLGDPETHKSFQVDAPQGGHEQPTGGRNDDQDPYQIDAKGDERTQLAIGLMYHGKGITQDYNKAMHWFLKSSEQGNADAQNKIGGMYDQGQGVQQNYKEALYWYQKAAKQGHTIAQHNLGLMYHEGQGAHQDYVQAYMWYSLAASQGDKDAVTNRDYIAKRMTHLQLAKAKKLVANWKPATREMEHYYYDDDGCWLRYEHIFESSKERSVREYEENILSDINREKHSEL
ncbi:MAG: sel1 repeat family protein [Magnetococcus sp. YQC-5]